MMSIEDYVFHNDELELDADNSDLNTVNMHVFYQDTRDAHESDVGFYLVKDDVIALAKHFKLTPNDIEDT